MSRLETPEAMGERVAPAKTPGMISVAGAFVALVVRERDAAILARLEAMLDLRDVEPQDAASMLAHLHVRVERFADELRGQP